MKFRWKLMLLLLCISLTPMLIARIFGVGAVRRMGGELLQRSQQRTVAETRDRLKLLVDTYSLILWRMREHVETALMIQAMEVERVLEQPIAFSGELYFAEDFNHGSPVPADTFPSALHFRKLRGGGMEMLNLSMAAPVIQLAPGVERQRVADSIRRLAALTPVYQKLYKRLEGVVSWHYTILDNGVHAAYPGHNGIPKPLDFRKQEWYREAPNRQVPWTDPFVDPETRQMVVAAARPVRFPDGRPAGVTAMIVPIDQMLNQRLLADNIPSESKAFMCYIAQRPDTGERGARIFARGDDAEFKRRNWRSRPGTDWLASPDAAQFQAMLDDVTAGIGNIRQMTHEGCGCLWAYGPVQGGAFLVVIIPESIINAPTRQAESYMQERIDHLIRITGYGMSAIVVLIVLTAFAFSRTVTRPLQQLVDGAVRLAEGHFDTRVVIRSRDEFGEMGRVFNGVVPRLEEHLRMSRSLALAREVQRSLLPQAHPVVQGLDIAGINISCDETSGDYYDFMNVGTGEHVRLGLAVGDVSDHGLPSALLMASARAYLRQRTSMPGDIGEIVSDLNRQLARDVEDSGRFMTLFYAEVDPMDRAIRWVRAGHDPGWIYDPGTDRFEEMAGGGLPLGVDEAAQYPSSERGLSPGQSIVVGTDGIWETHSPSGEMFGKRRLQRIVRSCAGRSSDAVVREVIEALTAFRQGRPLEDDVTLVVVRVTDRETGAEGDPVPVQHPG